MDKYCLNSGFKNGRLITVFDEKTTFCCAREVAAGVAVPTESIDMRPNSMFQIGFRLAAWKDLDRFRPDVGE